jgi:PAS domain-containing protein
LPDYIYVKDTSLNFLINNRAFVNWLAQNQKLRTSTKLRLTCLVKILVRSIWRRTKKLLKQAKPLLTGRTYCNQEGEELWLLTTKVPLKDHENKVTGILGISKDITERKEAERVIKESEEKYRTIIAQAPDGIFVSDTEYLFC